MLSEPGPFASTRLLRGRRSPFARTCADFVAGAALSQGHAQILWKAKHFLQIIKHFALDREIDL